THFHALRQHWGDAAWQVWCRALADNRPFVVDGNSVVVKIVARGEAWVGLTDSDDIADGQREGLPVAACPISEDRLLIPNTVAVIRGAPLTLAGQSLFEFLQRREVIDRLVAAAALESFSMSEAPGPTLRVDWPRLLADLESTTAQLNAIFLR